MCLILFGWDVIADESGTAILLVAVSQSTVTDVTESAQNTGSLPAVSAALIIGPGESTAHNAPCAVGS